MAFATLFEGCVGSVVPVRLPSPFSFPLFFPPLCLWIYWNLQRRISGYIILHSSSFQISDLWGLRCLSQSQSFFLACISCPTLDTLKSHCPYLSLGKILFSELASFSSYLNHFLSWLKRLPPNWTDLILQVIVDFPGANIAYRTQQPVYNLV